MLKSVQIWTGRVNFGSRLDYAEYASTRPDVDVDTI